MHFVDYSVFLLVFNSLICYFVINSQIMKKIILSLFAVLSAQLSVAQLFVKDGSTVFVKSTVLYTQDNINLEGTTASVAAGTEGKILLRNEAQLVQGKTGTSTNVGLGKISIFQEGTSNQFGYNYWCSPVGFPDATVGNTGFGIDMLSVPTTPTASTAAVILPMSNYNGVSGAGTLSIAPYWINRYPNGTTYTSWINSGSATTHPIPAGLGFSMKGTSGSDATTAGEVAQNNPYVPSTTTPPNPGVPSGQRYDFRGRPNDGDISISVSNVGATTVPLVTNNTLTGNPYPSAINLNLFLLENSGYVINYPSGTVANPGAPSGGVINGTAYFWEHEKPATSHNLTQYLGGYGSYVPNGLTAASVGTYNVATWKTYNGDGSVNNPAAGLGSVYSRMFSPVGQGFMVQGTAVGNAVMRNRYRVYRTESVANESTFNKNSASQTVNTVSENWDEIPNAAGIDYTQFSRGEVPQIKLHTTFNETFTKEITLAFNPNTTDGYDLSMDALQVGGALGKDIFFPLNDSPYVISTLPFDITKRIPVTLKADAQDLLKVKVGALINFTGSNEVFLYDGATGLYHDILNNTFEITLPAGTYANRFEVTFQNALLSTPSITKNDFVVVQNNNNQLLSISNPNVLDVKSVTVYDISGKMIMNKSGLGAKSVYEFPTGVLSDGVYVVKLQTTNNQTLSQKIIVGNSK